MDGLALPGIVGLAAEYLIKTSVVLVVALAAAAALRRRPAAVRHFVTASALIGLLLLPLLSLVPAGWRTSLLPARPDPAAATPALLSTTAVAAPVFAVPGDAAPDALGPAGARPPALAGIPSGARTAAFGTFDAMQPATAVDPVTVASPNLSAPAAYRADGPAAMSSARWSRGALFAAADSVIKVLWAAGLGLLLLRLAAGLVGAARLTARAETLGGPSWRLLLERFMRLVRLRREVVVKGHPDVLVPLTWGWHKPVVLLPAGAGAWTDAERSSALCHELSHIKRADFLVMLVVRLSLAVFWWNPLCWAVYRILLKEQERACDELVLRAGIRPSTYAASLLAFRRAAGFRWSPSAALLGMLGRVTFAERLAAILKQNVTFKEVTMRTKFALAGVLILAVALVGTSRPAAAGIEKVEGSSIIAETALPSPAGFDVPLPCWNGEQEKSGQAATQEKETAKKKKEKEAERSIIVKTGKSAQGPLVITITEGDTVKTITVDKPLTIIDGKDGKSLVLSSEGKEIEVLRGEPLSLKIAGGELKVLKEGEWIEGGESGVLKIVKEGEEGRSIVFYGRPGDIDEDVKVIKRGEFVKVQPGERLIIKEGEDIEEGAPVIAWTAKELGKEGGVWVVKGSTDEPGKAVWISAEGLKYNVMPFGDKDMLEKVRALREQLAAVKAKKLDLTALEESLKKLEAELEAQEKKLEELSIKFDKVPAPNAPPAPPAPPAPGAPSAPPPHMSPRPGKAPAPPAPAAAPHQPPAPGAPPAPPAPPTKVYVESGKDGERTVNLAFSVAGGDALTPEDIERAVAVLKEEMPAGMEILEHKLDASSGMMTFKIGAPSGTKVDAKDIRALVDKVKEALKKLPVA